MNTHTLQTKRSSELQTGDVVVTHHMRVLLGERHTFEHQDSTTYAFDGTVLNRGEVSALLVPMSFTPNNQWTIQGNDRASWRVEPGCQCGCSLIA